MLLCFLIPLILFVASLGIPFIMTSSGTQLVVKNDFVLLTCSVNWWFRHKFELSLSNVTFGDVISDQVVVEIYITSYEELRHSIKTRQQPLKAASPNNINLTNTQRRTFFSNCSDYPNKCILESYQYLVESDSAFINFNITLSSFVPGYTQVRISAFDNLRYYQDYLEGTNYSPCKTFYADSLNWRFDLTSLEVNEASSYLFVVIEDMKGSISWFTVLFSGQENYYDGSNLKSVCQVYGSRKSVTVTISPSWRYKNCFIAQIPVEVGLVRVPSPQDLLNVSYRTVGFQLNGIDIILLAVTGLFFVLFVCVSMFILYCYVKFR